MSDLSWVPSVEFGSARAGWRESLLKALCYRLFMVALTVAIAYAFTADSTASLQIGIVTNVLKTGTYYAYERFWTHFHLEGRSHG